MTNPFAVLYQLYVRGILVRDCFGYYPKEGDRSRASVAKLPERDLSILRIASTLGCLAGLTAILVGCSSNQVSDSPTPIPTVPAKSISSEQVKNYAKAVMAIEPKRQAAYSEIQKITNDEKVPDINCTKKDSIAALGKNIQDIAVNYCKQAKKIGQTQGLTIAQFNTITASAQSDTELRQRIQNEILRLQR